MRELFLIRSESTQTSLVFAADVDATGNPQTPDTERFFLAVDDETRQLLMDSLSTDTAGAKAGVADAGDAAADASDAAADAAAEKTTAQPQSIPPEPLKLMSAVSTPAPSPSPNQPDASLSAPLTMRPREIQDRIRAGASIAELAELMGVAPSRVEPFAHPVLLERARMVDVAKASHPVRDDGPAKLSLAEILATAFTARGANFAEAKWDSYRNSSNQWTVAVRWSMGQSENIATWVLQNHMSQTATTLPSNDMAADLTDPEFTKPVPRRTLQAVDSADVTTEIPVVPSPASLPTDLTTPTTPTTNTQQSTSETTDFPTPEDLLQNPDPEKIAGASRRRKAVTPHWEDVLLGVRTNTKRPRK
ncbi:septation protein SepH [Corynebacterium caspium]|uniref:septation protein SepH n=1 Tax=Corynebacterium caspium TaxID=234828 RepID=UPI0003626BA0|nr:septation protein SepH [Corynebacterium caspium]WKD58923.1 hypothetical protein CCASP_02580 [Corynebacterium caspium DSM 44850]